MSSSRFAKRSLSTIAKSLEVAIKGKEVTKPKRTLVSESSRSLAFKNSLAFGLSLLACLSIWAGAVEQSMAEDDVSVLKSRIETLEAELAKRPRDPSAYPVPTKITFCGDQIDLSKTDIRRRFELEVIKIIKNRYQVQLYINRATSVFPVIDELAEELNTCADLKFLAVVESALKPKVVSRSKATGWWQFMPATAKGFKLKVIQGLDERSDLRASTRAALTYLKRLYKRFDSWPLAMAGYNTGPNRLKRSSKKQKRGQFWNLDLYTEAERYSPRVLAMYHVLTHLKEYDFGRDLTQGWPQEPLEGYRLKLKKAHYTRLKSIKVKQKIKPKRRGRKGKKQKTRYRTVSKRVTVINDRVKFTPLSIALDLPVRDLRRFNPHLNGEHLPFNVNFNLYLPPGRQDSLARALKLNTVSKTYQNKATQGEQNATHLIAKVKVSAPLEQKPLRAEEAIKSLGGEIKGSYIISEGDQLWQIAARSRLSLKRLKLINGLGPLSTLKVGQRLKLSLD